MKIDTTRLYDIIEDRVRVVREYGEPEDLAQRFEDVLSLRLLEKSDLKEFGRGLASGPNTIPAALLPDGEVIFILGSDGEGMLPKKLHDKLAKGRAYIDTIVKQDLPLHSEAQALPPHIAYIVEKKGLSPDTIASLCYALGGVDLLIDGQEYSFSDHAIRCEVSMAPIVRVNRKSVTIAEDAIPVGTRLNMKGQPLGKFIGIEHMEGATITSVRTSQGFTNLVLDLG